MKRVVFLLALAITPACAADKALILNDQQQLALRQVLDAAIRANGLNQISRNAIGLSDMLDAAGVVQPDPKPAEAKP